MFDLACALPEGEKEKEINRLNLFIRGPKVGFTSPSWVMGEGLGKGFLKILKVYTSMYLTILL